MVIRAFGTEGIAERLREHCALARTFAGWVEASTDWTVMAPVPFSLVCFRYTPKGMSDVECDARNEAIMHAVNETGDAFLSHTKLRGRFTLRLAIGNIRTEERHVARAWQRLREAATATENG
jgi:aromatic-L-amino-acid decarboxylase